MQVLPLFTWFAPARVKSETIRSRSLWVHVALVAAMGVGGAHAQTASIAVDQVDEVTAGRRAAVARDVLYLFQRFAMEPSARSATIYIDVTPSAWSVGSSAGPAATKAQLKAVFGNLQHLIVTGRCTQAAIGASHRPCAVALGAPDFAGIVNPQFGNEVFGWVATAPATTLGTGDTASTAMRYFGLLSPMRHASTASPRAIVAFRYLQATSMHVPAGFDSSTASLIIHNDRLLPRAQSTPEGYDALARRIAGR